jgi:hypothetical protein
MSAPFGFVLGANDVREKYHPDLGYSSGGIRSNGRPALTLSQLAFKAARFVVEACSDLP